MYYRERRISADSCSSTQVHHHFYIPDKQVRIEQVEVYPRTKASIGIFRYRPDSAGKQFRPQESDYTKIFLRCII